MSPRPGTKRGWADAISSTRSTVLARVALLLGVVACLLIGIRFAPNVEIGVIGHPTSKLVNDTGQTVVVLRCVRTCEQPDQPVQLGPGRTLRLEPGSAVAWLVEDDQGARLGCITLPASSGQPPGRVYVSRAAACPS